MSNRAYIEVVTEVSRKTGIENQVVKVFDDYDSISIAVFEGKAPEDDRELFDFVINELEGNPIKQELIGFAHENEKGISIDGAWYDFAEWKDWYH